MYVDHVQVMQASFGASIRSLFGQQIALSVAHPADGCAALDNQADVAGTVVLVLRGTCFFAVKVSAFFQADIYVIMSADAQKQAGKMLVDMPVLVNWASDAALAGHLKFVHAQSQ